MSYQKGAAPQKTIDMKSTSISYAEQIYVDRSLLAKRIQVVFGSPKEECRHQGICRIEPDVWDSLTSREGSSACSACPTHVEIDDFGRLQLHFLRSAITDEQFDRQFVNEVFTVTDKYELPFWLKEALGFQEPTENWCLSPCTYPVLSVGPLLTVSIRLMHVQIDQQTDSSSHHLDISLAA